MSVEAQELEQLPASALQLIRDYVGEETVEPAPSQIKVVAENKKKEKKQAEFDLNDYVVKKKFGPSQHCVWAKLFEHKITKTKIVGKRFDSKKKKQFEIEVSHLKHLQTCHFVPKLIHADEEHYVIYMSYCGKQPESLSSEQKKDIQRKLKILKDGYGMTRPFYIYVTHVGYPKLANLAIDEGGHLKLIDLGVPWSRK
jgi:hypothetical protein